MSENNQHSSIRHIQNSAEIHQGFVYNRSHARHANTLLSKLPSSMDELFSASNHGRTGVAYSSEVFSSSAYCPHRIIQSENSDDL